MKKRKVLVIGFIVALIIAIPISIVALKSQQNNVSKATPATTLTFSPPSKSVNSGDSFNLDVVMNPGTNKVSFITLAIQYDQTKVKKGTGFQVNASAFPTTLEGPTYDQCSGNTCTMSITLSVGADPTKVITTQTTVATVNFQAVSGTSGTPTQITFESTNTKVLSIGASDQQNENVLASTTPASIDIAGGAATTPTTSAGTPTTAPTQAPGASATPTGAPTPTTQAAASATPTVIAQVSNQSPECKNLTATETSGNAPLTTILTATGTDADGTISKVVFNFGDGTSQTVNTGYGIGTSSVNAQYTHTYQTSNNYTATAILYDNNGAASDIATCSQTIAVSTAQGDTPVPATATPTTTASSSTTTQSTTSQTVPVTGPADTLMGVGVFGILLSLVGGLLIFGL